MAQSLQELLLNEAKRPVVITDAQQLLDEEVTSKKGASGLAVRGAYTAVKTVKSGIITETITKLLPDFATQLQPFYDEYHANPGGQSLTEFLTERSDAVSDALLAITDKRAEGTSRTSVKKAYEKIRPNGKKNVEEAVPRLGALIEKHTAS